jgi:hypothetical protein
MGLGLNDRRAMVGRLMLEGCLKLGRFGTTLHTGRHPTVPHRDALLTRRVTRWAVPERGLEVKRNLLEFLRVFSEGLQSFSTEACRLRFWEGRCLVHRCSYGRIRESSGRLLMVFSTSPVAGVLFMATAPQAIPS